MIIREIVASLFLISGLFFFSVGTIGLIRLPDIYTRMHASTKCDTLGVSLILIGIMINLGLTWLSLKLLLIIIFIWLTNPTAAHAIGRAAYDTHEISRQNIPLWDESEVKADD
ncbi:MAG: monovalent cation/H(+) antiporter subunit G [Bacillota bacterium]